MLFNHIRVFWWILLRVSIEGADGFMWSVSRLACRNMPGGGVPVVMALFIISLWCVA